MLFQSSRIPHSIYHPMMDTKRELFMNNRSGRLAWFIALVVTACVPLAPTLQPVTETLTIPPTPTPTMKVWTYDEMTVGIIQAGSGDKWHTANTASFEEVAQLLGIKLKFYDAQFKTEVQIVAFRGFIQDPDVNVIVLAALEPTGWEDLLKQAKAAGKVVIFEDLRIEAPEDLYATYVGSDFVEEGRKAAIEMCKLLEGSHRNVWELTGSVEGPDAYKTNGRSQGFHEKMGECGITVTQIQIANLDGAEGEAVMEAFLKKNTNIQGLFAQNEDMVLSAIQAIKGVGLKPGIDIKIVSIDATPAVFNVMLVGELNVCLEYNPLLAPQVYEAALRTLNGEMLPKWIPSQEGFFYPEGVKRILENPYDHSHP
jgi:ABC-type sugar transport system substrate-binding protein